MLRDVTEARALDAFRLSLRFDDGQAGEIDIRDLVPFEGVFAPSAIRNSSPRSASIPS